MVVAKAKLVDAEAYPQIYCWPMRGIWAEHTKDGEIPVRTNACTLPMQNLAQCSATAATSPLASTPSTHSPCCGWRRSGRSTPWSGRWRNSPSEMVWGVRASVHEHGVRWKRRAARAPVLWHWQLQVRTHTSGGLGPCFSASPKRNGFLLKFLLKVPQNGKFGSGGPWSLFFRLSKT